MPSLKTGHQSRLIVKIRSTKYEFRNNIESPKFKFREFGHLNFEIVSDFDIRISDLPLRFSFFPLDEPP